MVTRVLEAHKVQKVILAHKATLVQMETRALEATRVPKVILARKETRVRKATLVPKVIQAHKATWVNKAQQANKAQLVLQVVSGILVKLDLMVSRAQLVLQDPRDTTGEMLKTRDPRARLVKLD
jgi:hypothetical protein